ncbi:MAG: hypothetical protein ACYDCL_14520 [Myxococcales bacterium]
MTEAQIQRYARQLLLPEIGGSGQERLLASRVTVRAKGPAAEALSLYLAAAGVSLGEGGLAVGDRASPERWLLSEAAAAWSPENGPCQACLLAALSALAAPPGWALPAAASAAGALVASQILLQLAGRGLASPALWSFWPQASRSTPGRRPGCHCG